MTRRDFLAQSAVATGGLMCNAAFGGALKPSPLSWGALLHLGSNMWDDFADDPDGWAKSREEELVRPNPQVSGGKRRSQYHSYVIAQDDLWRKTVDCAAANKLNLVFIDLGEAVVYPSHPELAVVGSWPVEKLRSELARMRAMGLEPMPKLNFSSCHDSWLKWYHRMLSTPKYYEVVADLIKDVVEIFDHPRYFHIGYDEEMAIAAFNHFHVTIRQGDLWWKDLNYTIGQVERHGVRPVMWADAMWVGREAYLKRMSKGVLQANWYYRSDFSEKKLAWNYEFEKRGGWGETVNGAAGFLALQEAGFEQLPCTSNWAENGAAEAMLKFAKERMDMSLVKGFITAPWAMSVPDRVSTKKTGDHAGALVGGAGFVCSGIELFAKARQRHFPAAL